MQDFRNLQVWQKAHQLTLAFYQHTHSFPSVERYGLTSQLRRAGSSIHLLLARDLGYLAHEVYQTSKEQVDRIMRMLHGLLRKARTE